MVRNHVHHAQKHIKAKVFLTKDYPYNNEIECHTEKHVTKPKQGTQLKIDRSMLMNVDIDYDGKLERKNTNPQLDKEKPFIPVTRPNSTVG